GGFTEYARTHVPGGRAAILARIADARVRAYLEQPFLAASWYDVLPYLHLVSASAAAAGLPTSQFVAARSAWQADRDVAGIYRLLLKLSSPEAVAARFGVIFARYFAFATASVDCVGPGFAEMTVARVPQILVGWYRHAVVSAGDRILELAGARDLRVGFSVSEPCGHAIGLPLVRFRVRRTWSRGSTSA